MFNNFFINFANNFFVNFAMNFLVNTADSFFAASNVDTRVG